MLKHQLHELVIAVLLLISLSACSEQAPPSPSPTMTDTPPIPTSTATFTSTPSPTATPSPTSTPTPTPLATPTITTSPTPLGRLVLIKDQVDDGQEQEDGTACLPDYLDIQSAVITKTAEGGLDVTITMAGELPTSDIAPGNNGIDFLIYFEEKKVTADVAFRLLPREGVFAPMYISPGLDMLSSDPGFTVEYHGPTLTMHIASELIEAWPQKLVARLSTFYCPQGSTTCCGDQAPDQLDVFPLAVQ